jgi:hypothetical protein
MTFEFVLSPHYIFVRFDPFVFEEEEEKIHPRPSCFRTKIYLYLLLKQKKKRSGFSPSDMVVKHTLQIFGRFHICSCRVVPRRWKLKEKKSMVGKCHGKNQSFPRPAHPPSSNLGINVDGFSVPRALEDKSNVLV